MAGTLVISTLSDGTNSTSSTNCIRGSSLAWVNFDGSVATPTIRASYNISSVTKLSTGIYYVYFTNALTDDKYVTVFGGCRTISSASDYGFCPQIYSQSTTMTALNTPSTTGATADWPRVMLSFFR